jgi:hypothetical protein
LFASPYTYIAQKMVLSKCCETNATVNITSNNISYYTKCHSLSDLAVHCRLNVSGKLWLCPAFSSWGTWLPADLSGSSFWFHRVPAVYFHENTKSVLTYVTSKVSLSTAVWYCLHISWTYNPIPQLAFSCVLQIVPWERHCSISTFWRKWDTELFPIPRVVFHCLHILP